MRRGWRSRGRPRRSREVMADKTYRTKEGGLVREVTVDKKERATTFRTSKGTTVSVDYPDIYIEPAFLTSEDVTNPTEMEEKLSETVKDWYKPEFTRRSKDIADQVKSEFQHAWDGYTQHAWGHDYLLPISRSYGDLFGVPLGLSIVVAMSPLYLMELDSEFDTAVEWVENNLDFNQNVSVAQYSLCIGWLGPLINAYLTTGSKTLLDLARNVGRRLLQAFASPTGIPYRNVNLRTGAVSDNINTPSWVSLLLEMGMLSKLTNDASYYNAAKNGMNGIYTRRSALDFLAGRINVDTGAVTDTTIGLNMVTEFVETLIKGWLLFNDSDLLDWAGTVMAPMLELVPEINNGMLWFPRVNMNTGAVVNRKSGPYDENFCMNLALLGRTTEAEAYAKSIYSVWSRFGLTCSRIDFGTMTVEVPRFTMYPEFVEGVFHLYHLTGDEYWKQAGYTVFQNLVKYCKYDIGYTNIADIRTMEREDNMTMPTEAFTYLYLLFADSPRYTYSPIFTTTAMPLKGLVPT